MYFAVCTSKITVHLLVSYSLNFKSTWCVRSNLQITKVPTWTFGHLFKRRYFLEDFFVLCYLNNANSNKNKVFFLVFKLIIINMTLLNFVISGKELCNYPLQWDRHYLHHKKLHCTGKTKTCAYESWNHCQGLASINEPCPMA